LVPRRRKIRGPIGPPKKRRVFRRERGKAEKRELRYTAIIILVLRHGWAIQGIGDTFRISRRLAQMLAAGAIDLCRNFHNQVLIGFSDEEIDYPGEERDCSHKVAEAVIERFLEVDRMPEKAEPRDLRCAAAGILIHEYRWSIQDIEDSFGISRRSA